MSCVRKPCPKYLYVINRPITFIILLLCAAISSYAQAVNATLLGTVTDASGATVANAKVTITDLNTNAAHNGQTNESGNYTFPELPPGKYSVTIEAPGFKRETRTGVDLIVNTATRVDFQLRPGEITESIDVTAAAPALQTDRSDTGRKLETVLFQDMPLGVNRNF